MTKSLRRLNRRLLRAKFFSLALFLYFPLLYWLSFRWLVQLPVPFEPPSTAPSEVMEPLTVTDWANMTTFNRLYLKQSTRWMRYHAKLLERYHRRESMDVTTLFQLEQRLYPWLPQSLASMLQDPFYRDDEAIVMSVYNGAFETAYLTIRLLQHWSASKPIHIFFIDEQDLGKSQQEKLQLFPNVQLLQLSQILPPKAMEDLKPYSYSVKPLAILLAPCQRCMFLDSDAFFLTHPDNLFQRKDFIETGALFFRDRNLGNTLDVAREFVASFIPRPYARSGLYSEFMRGYSFHEQESGVLVVDKTRPHVVAGLAVATVLNQRAVRDATWSVMHGDKETFWIAMEIIQGSYAFNNRRAGNLGKRQYYWMGFWQAVCGTTMVHVDDDDRLLWFNGGLEYAKYGEKEEGVKGEPAVFEAWTVGGGWDLTQSGTIYCMRSLFQGWLSWIDRNLGSSVRPLSDEQKILLDTLMSWK
jgi:hypothetical protein